jgi:hypothetical protein
MYIYSESSYSGRLNSTKFTQFYPLKIRFISHLLLNTYIGPKRTILRAGDRYRKRRRRRRKIIRSRRARKVSLKRTGRRVVT